MNNEPVISQFDKWGFLLIISVYIELLYFSEVTSTEKWKHWILFVETLESEV